MLDSVDQRLTDWVKQTVGSSVQTFYTLPPADAEEEGIGLYLLSFAPMSTPRTAERPPVQFMLRYLITSWSKDAPRAHALIGQIIVAAFDAAQQPETAGYQADLSPLSADWWLALGIAPRPAFILNVPYSVERETPTAPRVRRPLVVQGGNAAQVRGRLLAPDAQPIAGARIDVPSIQSYTFTDHTGAFQLNMLPRHQSLPVRIRAKGKTLVTALNTLSDQPIVLTWDPLQD